MFVCSLISMVTVLQPALDLMEGHEAMLGCVPEDVFVCQRIKLLAAAEKRQQTFSKSLPHCSETISNSSTQAAR